ncbi:hypothetical protein BC827DRAFT_1269411 [Russula dissimulans]|nr:hypothetical protein BC827DRAFT_1269411 [Russula dissimulans]
MTAPALVTLFLSDILPSDFLPLCVFLQRLSLIPHLETLEIGLHSPIPDHGVESQRSNIPVTTHVTLPNLRLFVFKASNRLQYQLVFFIPHLLQFMRATESLKSRFCGAEITFSTQGVFMGMSRRGGTGAYAFHMSVVCKHLDWQVGCAAQNFNALSTVLFVEDLSLEYQGHRITPELYQDTDLTEWYELLTLTSFGDLRTLRVDDEFVPLLTRSRQAGDGDSLMELISELRELPCTGFKDPDGPFTTLFSGRLAPLSQWSFQFYTIRPLPENRFKNDLKQFTAATGTRLSERDLVIEGRQINLWDLHKAVFLRNGYEALCNDILRHFDQAYMTGVLNPLAPSARVVQVRRPTTEEFFAPKRWVDEQKRKAFSCYCDLAGYPTIPECDVQDFHRNLVHLDQILANIEKYIHFSFAALKKEVVVRRMFSMMASSKFQLDELKKPKPRTALKRHAFWDMIQEADNMDKCLRTVASLLHRNPPQLSSVATPASFTRPVPPTAPEVPSALSRPPPVPSLQTLYNETVSGAGPRDGDIHPSPPPIPIATTPTPPVSTSGITAVSDTEVPQREGRREAEG